MILKRKMKSWESCLIDLDIHNANEPIMKKITNREEVCWLMSCTQLLCGDINQRLTAFVQTSELLHHTVSAWLGDLAILKSRSLLGACPNLSRQP